MVPGSCASANEKRISFPVNDVAEKLKGTFVNFGGLDDREQINSVISEMFVLMQIIGF